MKNNKGISIKTIGLISTIIIAIISSLLFGSLFLLFNKFNDVQKSTSDYMSWKQTALDVKEASDYLTDQVRYYVYNKHKIYMDNYFYEAKVTKRRDKAIETIEQYLPNTEAHKGISEAVERSNALMKDEYYAMRLIIESEHIVMDETYPIEIKEVSLSNEDIALSEEEQFSLALEKVIGEKYLEDKDYINQKVSSATSEIDNLMELHVIKATDNLKNILIVQRILISLNIIVIAGVIFLSYHHMIKPLDVALSRIQNNEFMDVTGSREYRYLAASYNTSREQSNLTKEKLQYEAEHDQLTGLYNRTGYDSIYRRAKLEKCFYILIDVDYFKKVNDKYGHEMGDKVLKNVASILVAIFNQDNEYAFRLGGDEFSVLVEANENTTIEDITNKCHSFTNMVNNEGKKIPEISLSIGIAKGDENDTTDTLFKKADKALYSAKNNGRHNVTVYSKE